MCPTKSGKIVLDTFTGKGIRYYNKALTTRVGLFRWYDFITSEDGGAVGDSDLRSREYNIDTDGFNTGWIYLTPNGGGKTEMLFSFWWVLYGFDFKVNHISGWISIFVINTVHLLIAGEIWCGKT